MKYRKYRRHTEKVHKEHLKNLSKYSRYPGVWELKPGVYTSGRGKNSKWIKHYCNCQVRKAMLTEALHGGEYKRVADYWWSLI